MFLIASFNELWMSKMVLAFLTSSSVNKAGGWIWHWWLPTWLMEKKNQTISLYYIPLVCRITAAENFSSSAFYAFEVAALAKIWNSSSTNFSRIVADPEYHTPNFFFMTEFFFFPFHLGIFSNSSSNKERFLNTWTVLGPKNDSRGMTAHRILISYYTQTIWI